MSEGTGWPGQRRGRRRRVICRRGDTAASTVLTTPVLPTLALTPDPGIGGLPRSTIWSWTSKSACSALLRRQHFMRGGCSDCALRESAWSWHRPCITTTRPGSRHCGPPGSGGDLLQGTPGAVAGMQVRHLRRCRRDARLAPGVPLRHRVRTRSMGLCRDCLLRACIRGHARRQSRARQACPHRPARQRQAGQTAPGEASRMLRDRYGVPVGGAECVPEWLTGNVRPSGPPPDSESLNLDLERLDLPHRGDRS